jgi:hypothetical protein
LNYINFELVFEVATLAAGHAWWSCRAAYLQMTHAIFGYRLTPAHLGGNPSVAAQYLLEGDTDHHKGQDWLDIQQHVLERDVMLRFLESEVEGKPWQRRTVEDFLAWYENHGSGDENDINVPDCDSEDKTVLLLKQLINIGQQLDLMHHAMSFDDFGKLEAAISGDLLSMQFARGRDKYGIILMLLLADYGEAGVVRCRLTVCA